MRVRTEMYCSDRVPAFGLLFIEQYQGDDPLCKGLKVKIETGQAAAEYFTVHKNLISYIPRTPEYGDGSSLLC